MFLIIVKYSNLEVTGHSHLMNKFGGWLRNKDFFCIFFLVENLVATNSSVFQRNCTTGPLKPSQESLTNGIAKKKNAYCASFLSCSVTFDLSLYITNDPMESIVCHFHSLSPSLQSLWWGLSERKICEEEGGRVRGGMQWGFSKTSESYLVAMVFNSFIF